MIKNLLNHIPCHLQDRIYASVISKYSRCYANKSMQGCVWSVTTKTLQQMKENICKTVNDRKSHTKMEHGNWKFKIWSNDVDKKLVFTNTGKDKFYNSNPCLLLEEFMWCKNILYSTHYFCLHSLFIDLLLIPITLFL